MALKRAFPFTLLVPHILVGLGELKHFSPCLLLVELLFLVLREGLSFGFLKGIVVAVEGRLELLEVLLDLEVAEELNQVLQGDLEDA